MKWYYDFCIFFLLIWSIRLIDEQMLKCPCIPRINFIWWLYMIILMYFWIWSANICWGLLHIYSWKILRFLFVFFWWCPCLISKLWWYMLLEHIWKFSILWKSLNRKSNSLVKLFGLCLLFWGGIWCLFQLLYLWWVYSHLFFLIQSWNVINFLGFIISDTWYNLFPYTFL